MADAPITIRLAQTIGLTTSSALAGSVFTLSAFLVPRLLESPSPLLLKQWKNLFEGGRAFFPAASSIPTLCFGYLAYKASQNPSSMPHQWKIYVVSAFLCIGIAPYTLIAMASVNQKLLKKAAEINVERDFSVKDETAHQLVDKWATLNVARAVMLATGGLLSTWMALE